MTLTVWKNGDTVRLHQLSADEADGSPQEQIAHLATLEGFAGFTCVEDDYTGSAPDTDPALWRWQDGEIVATVPVPASVTPRQVRLLLLQKGILASVEAMIAQQDQAAKITWEFATEFKRDDALLNTLGQALGLNSAQIDQFFIEAATL